MQYDGPVCKQQRILLLQEQLLRGMIVNKEQCAAEFHVNEKSIQRDLDDLRAYFSERRDGRSIVYDRKAHGYRMSEPEDVALTNSEIFAICKILLESRSMVEAEMDPILNKLLAKCTPAAELQRVKGLIENERFHYVPPHHGQRYVQSLWEIASAVYEHRLLEITYLRADGQYRPRLVEPVGILFSEYYFYLAAVIRGINKAEHFADPTDKGPTIYRIDRIIDYRVTAEHFRVPYAGRFQEGEMRKRIQFMYGGRLVKIRFCYTGPDLNAILDRLPTAKILRQSLEGPIVEAEVYDGPGLDMWLNSQGKNIIFLQKQGCENVRNFR